MTALRRTDVPLIKQFEWQRASKTTGSRWFRLRSELKFVCWLSANSMSLWDDQRLSGCNVACDDHGGHPGNVRFERSFVRAGQRKENEVICRLSRVKMYSAPFCLMRASIHRFHFSDAISGGINFNSTSQASDFSCQASHMGPL